MLLAHENIAPGQGHAAGRALLARLYLQHTGKPMPPIAVTELGKPYFTEGSLHFSITHTPNHVFCALSDRPVGIDAEELTRTVNPRLADKLLSEAERAQYDRALDKPRALLTFWVLKEALGKCTGQGMQLWPNHTRLSLDDPRVTEQQGCLVAVIENEKETYHAF